MNNLFSGLTNNVRFHASLSQDERDEAYFNRWLENDFCAHDLDSEFEHNVVLAVFEGRATQIYSELEKAINELFEKHCNKLKQEQDEDQE
jgi:plasmid replication initiation protein